MRNIIDAIFTSVTALNTIPEMEIMIPDNMTIIIFRNFSSIICLMVISCFPFNAYTFPATFPASMAY